MKKGKRKGERREKRGKRKKEREKIRREKEEKNTFSQSEHLNSLVWPLLR